MTSETLAIEFFMYARFKPWTRTRAIGEGSGDANKGNQLR
jgi:hypothetical protein